MNNRQTASAGLVLVTVLALPAQAALIDRGGGLIYDDVLNITWLQDANYAKTSGYDTNGLMNWQDAVAWAANLTYYDSVRGVTYDDWRLPTMVDTGIVSCDFAYSGTDCGYNVQTYDAVTNKVFSEMAYMYYVNLGLKAEFNPDGSQNLIDWGIHGDGTKWGQNDVGPIRNLQSLFYWTDLNYQANSIFAWYFATWNGGQNYSDKSSEYYAWAVRPGDVIGRPVAVPEPRTLALMLLGLTGLAAARRRGWFASLRVSFLAFRGGTRSALDGRGQYGWARTPTGAPAQSPDQAGFV